MGLEGETGPDQAETCRPGSRVYNLKAMVGVRRKRFQEKDLYPQKFFLTAAGVNARDYLRSCHS